MMADQPDQARKEIDEIIKLDSKNPVGYVMLGQLQFNTGRHIFEHVAPQAALRVAEAFVLAVAFRGRSSVAARSAVRTSTSPNLSTKEPTR